MGFSNLMLLLDDFDLVDKNDNIGIDLACLIMRNSGSVQLINTTSLILGTIFRLGSNRGET